MRSEVTAEQERDEAIRLLAEWVVLVERGTSWDDWDEGYKDAAYRPCLIRERLDTAIAETRQRWSAHD